MMTVAYACDRCGRAIESQRSWLKAECGPAAVRWTEGLDLCAECVGELGRWLNPDEGGSGQLSLLPGLGPVDPGRRVPAERRRLREPAQVG